MSDKDQEEAGQQPETATAVVDELALYRKRRKEELLKEVSAISDLRANVNLRVITSIVNSACNKAYC